VGYRENTGLLDYTTALQLYRNNNPASPAGAPYNFGAAFQEYVNSTNCMVGFSASEARIRAFFCRLDGGEWRLCDQRNTSMGVGEGELRQTGYSRETQFGLVYYEGIAGVDESVGSDILWHTHQLDIVAIDEAGNRGNPKTVKWRVDDVLPHVMINPRSLPDGGTRRVNQEHLRFEFASDDGGLLFACKLEGGRQLGVFQPCVSPFVATLDVDAVLQNGETTYRFMVHAMDAAQNEGSCAEATVTDVLASPLYSQCSAYTFAADFRVPVMTFTVGMPPSLPETAVENIVCDEKMGGRAATCFYGENHAMFVFQGHRPGLRYECQLDAQIWYECGIGYRALSVPPHLDGVRVSAVNMEGKESFINIPDGLHIFKARVINEYHTVGAVQQFSWKSDTSAPIAYFLQTPPPLSHITAGIIRFAANPPGATNYVCSWDGLE